jgi:hypothetical protein
MPLVHGPETQDERVLDPRRAHARKIRPEYARGQLVRVAGGRNQAEAEMIAMLLLEEGVPSIVRRSAGFDVPEFLAGGPRDVVVPEAGAAAARELLGAAALAAPPAAGRGRSRRHAAALLMATVAGGLATALVAWGLLQLAV